MTKIQAVRGMNDILPDQTIYWQKLENIFRVILASYGYHEIRLPLLEKTQLFKRGIGEATDIIEKEMYTFLDRHDESLSLRPEGTAGCVRAVIEHGLAHRQTQKLWYAGPMFRYERPQKGRYRQFFQWGVETFGYTGHLIEAELILLMTRCFEKLGISQKVNLQLNILGSLESRLNYREKLVTYCQQHYNILDEDSRRRLITNPLRILDSKNNDIQAMLKQGPQLKDYLDEPSKNIFNQLCELLQQLNIVFDINPYLVRGLDYYTGTVMSNIHPFFAGVTAEVAAAWTWTFWQQNDMVLTQGTTKPQIISETGWPSSGGTDCGGTTGNCAPGQSGSIAGVDEMNTYMGEWVCQALENGTEYFW